MIPVSSVVQFSVGALDMHTNRNLSRYLMDGQARPEGNENRPVAPDSAGVCAAHSPPDHALARKIGTNITFDRVGRLRRIAMTQSQSAGRGRADFAAGMHCAGWLTGLCAVGAQA